MFLMMSLTAFSQNTKEVKISTLKNIYKEIRKCDTLRVAYDKKSQNLNHLINTNLTIFTALDAERNKRLAYEKQLKKANDLIIKQSKKRNNTFLFGVSGVVVGLVVGVLIN